MQLEYGSLEIKKVKGTSASFFRAGGCCLVDNDKVRSCQIILCAMTDTWSRVSNKGSQEQDDNYTEMQPIQEREQNIAITHKILMCRSCAPTPLIDLQHS